MSATDILRRMLDERGVWWHDTKIGKGFITVYEHDGITWIVTEHSSGRLSVKGCVKPTQGHYDGMTPEQAIAATLGTGTCKVDVLNTGDCAGYECSEYIMHCNGCGHEFGHVLYNEDGDVWMSEPPNYCPICGRRIEQ